MATYKDLMTGLNKKVMPTKKSYGSYGSYLGESAPKVNAIDTSKPYANYLTQTALPTATQTAPKANYGEVDLETGGTTGGAYTDRRGRQFPLNNNSSGEIDLETGGTYSDYIDLYGGSLDTQRQQALNQIEVNRQLGKSTYGVTAEQLGQAGLTGSGYAQFLDSQNEMVAEEAKKGLEVAVEDEKTTFLTDNGATVQYKNAEEIGKGIDSGAIGSVSALNTINSRGIINEEEYKTLTDKLQGKAYGALNTELYKIIVGGKSKGEWEETALSQKTAGEISEKLYNDLYYNLFKNEYDANDTDKDYKERLVVLEGKKTQLGSRYEDAKKLIEERRKNNAEKYKIIAPGKGKYNIPDQMM